MCSWHSVPYAGVETILENFILISLNMKIGPGLRG